MKGNGKHPIRPTSRCRPRALSESEKKFCECIAAGDSNMQAYATAYPAANRRTARTRVWKVLRRGRVVAEIARLRAWEKERAESALLTLLEKRRFLARVVRSQPALLVDESDLWQTITQTHRCAIYRVPDKIAAIIEDNKLAGHGEDNAMQGELAQLLTSLRK